MADFCEDGSEIFGSIKDGGFSDLQCDYQFLTKNCSMDPVKNQALKENNFCMSPMHVDEKAFVKLTV